MKNLLLLAATVYCSLSFAQQAPPTKWMKCYGGSTTDQGRAICHAPDSGFVIVGNSNSQNGDITSYKGSNDCWIVRLRPDGTIRWQKNIGGSADDMGWTVINTTDGGFIAGLWAQKNDNDCQPNKGNFDYGMVKLDSNGNMLWAKSLGGSAADQVTNCVATIDGGCIVIGNSASSDGDVSGNYGGNSDIWVVKLDAAGNIQWNKNYGGSSDDEGQHIKQTADGGYIFCGWTQSNDHDVSGNHGMQDVWIVKLDNTGNIIWQKTYGGTDNESAIWLEPTADGGYIVSAQSRSNNGDVSGNHGGIDIWALKINATGGLTWQKNYGGSQVDNNAAIKPLAAGGYIMSSISTSTDGDITDHKGSTTTNDAWIVRLDSAGGIIWKKSYGGIQYDWVGNILPTSDFGYVIAGTTYSNDGDVSGNHGGADVWVIRLGTDSTAIVSEPEPVAVNSVEVTEIKIWPTATSSIVHIQLPNGYEHAHIQVMDIMGRSRKNDNTNSLDRTIDMGDLPPGNYILQVLHKDIQNVFRISRF